MTSPTNDKPFGGFLTPTSNYTKLPHVLIEALPLFETLGELKVVLYILRHTWGYSEYGKPKRITLDEFEHGRKRADGTRLDNGVGMSKPSIVDGLKRATEHGFISAEVNAKDKARVKKLYTITMYLGVKELDIRCKETLHRTEKDTLERKSTASAQNADAQPPSKPLPEPTPPTLPKPVEGKTGATIYKAEPKQGRKVRRDLMFEAIFFAFMGKEYRRVDMTKSYRGRLNAIKMELLAHPLLQDEPPTPQEVRDYPARYKAQHPNINFPQDKIRFADWFVRVMRSGGRGPKADPLAISGSPGDVIKGG